MNLYSLKPPSAPGYPFEPNVAPYLQQLVDDGSWSQYTGAALEQLTAEIHTFTGCDSLLCSSGSVAVELALRACKIQAGDEVILAGYDYPGNFRCIEAVNALAVVVDVAPHSWSIDLNSLQDAITPQTKAIIASHLHGEIQDLIAIKTIAERHGIVVIEDACQVMGGKRAGVPLGSLGDIGIWSFGGSKLLTAGRGGAVLCNDAALMQRARVASQRSNDAVALSQLQAAVLIPQMKLLDEATALRWENARRLCRVLQQSEWCEPLHIESLGIENTAADNLPAFYKLGVMVCGDGEERERMICEASSRGAEIGPGFRGFASRSNQRCRRVGDLLQTREASQRTLLIHHRHLTAQADDIEKFGQELSALARSAQ